MDKRLEIRHKQVKKAAIIEIVKLMDQHNIIIEDIKKAKYTRHQDELTSIRKKRRNKAAARERMAIARKTKAEKHKLQQEAKARREAAAVS